MHIKLVLPLTFYKSYDIHEINQKQGWSTWGLSVSFAMKGIELILNINNSTNYEYFLKSTNYYFLQIIIQIKHNSEKETLFIHIYPMPSRPTMDIPLLLMMDITTLKEILSEETIRRPNLFKLCFLETLNKKALINCSNKFSAKSFRFQHSRSATLAFFGRKMKHKFEQLWQNIN